LEENYLTLHRTRLLRHGDAQLAFYRLAPEGQQPLGSMQKAAPPPAGDQLE
jgi:hypothetical protein